MRREQQSQRQWLAARSDLRKERTSAISTAHWPSGDHFTCVIFATPYRPCASSRFYPDRLFSSTPANASTQHTPVSTAQTLRERSTAAQQSEGCFRRRERRTAYPAHPVRPAAVSIHRTVELCDREPTETTVKQRKTSVMMVMTWMEAESLAVNFPRAVTSPFCSRASF